MTLSIANKLISSSASSKFVNSILKKFREKLKNYIFKGSIKENQSNVISLTEETDPQKLELEFKEKLAYATFCDDLYIFLSEPRDFSIRYLDSFKERILREKNPLFSQSKNLKMLFLIDLVKEIRKLRQKIAKNKASIFTESMQADIDQMIYKMYNNLPESTYDRLMGDELERECKEMAEFKERVKELYPDNIEAQESYLRLHGFV